MIISKNNLNKIILEEIFIVLEQQKKQSLRSRVAARLFGTGLALAGAMVPNNANANQDHEMQFKKMATSAGVIPNFHVSEEAKQDLGQQKIKQAATLYVSLIPTVIDMYFQDEAAQSEEVKEKINNLTSGKYSEETIQDLKDRLQHRLTYIPFSIEKTGRDAFASVSSGEDGSPKLILNSDYLKERNLNNDAEKREVSFTIFHEFKHVIDIYALYIFSFKEEDGGSYGSKYKPNFQDLQHDHGDTRHQTYTRRNTENSAFSFIFRHLFKLGAKPSTDQIINIFQKNGIKVEKYQNIYSISLPSYEYWTDAQIYYKDILKKILSSETDTTISQAVSATLPFVKGIISTNKQDPSSQKLLIDIGSISKNLSTIASRQNNQGAKSGLAQ